MSVVNDLGQPVGYPVRGWSPRQPPPRRTLAGRWCRLEPLDPDRHADALHQANARDTSNGLWTYLPYGPFADPKAYRTWVEEMSEQREAVFFAVVVADGDRALGVCALQRIDVSAGCVEVAHVAFSPALQKTTAATEAISLALSLVFDELGYRRVEWKCDALNAGSRSAAHRFGFSYEGTFRQALVVKGRNRDTAWFSITDSDWSRLKTAYAAWLAPENFGPDGRQILSLSRLTAGSPASSEVLS